MAYNTGYVDVSGYNAGYTGSYNLMPTISAADPAVEGQSETVTLGVYTANPTALRLGGTAVAFTFNAGVLTYTAPLLPNNPVLVLEVDVDGFTISTTIAYTNTYPYTHTPAVLDDNSILPNTSFGTMQMVELKVITDANATVLTVDWAGYETDNFVSAVADFVTVVSEVTASTDVTMGYHITETGATGTFTRTLYVPDTTPVAFTLTDVTGQALNDTVESNVTTVTGVDAATEIPISITGGSYAVSTDDGFTFGAYTTAAATVQLNYQVKVLLATSASHSTATSATLTIGGVSDTFTATTIADTTAPVITLLGDNPLVIVQGSTFTDPGATATDNADGPVAVTASGTVDTSVLGNSTITYTASDSVPNTATATRTVSVVLPDGIGPGRDNVIVPGSTFVITSTITSVAAGESLLAFITIGGTRYYLTINAWNAGEITVTAPANLPLSASPELTVQKINVIAA